jgi:ABC-type phosphate/phosphonate transport system substrate-binding protein
LKFKVVPAEEQSKLVSSLAFVIAQMSQSFGLQVVVRGSKNEEASNG